MTPALPELRAGALLAFAQADPAAKASAVKALRAQGPALALDPAARFDPATPPGRPARPRLVSPRQLPQRPLQRPEGRAALLHALAHIEFNAINLALDACWRFADLPAAWYHDWLGVATEEVDHFERLCLRLAAHGLAYGDLDAHDGLWTMAARTADDLLARLVAVPRTLEARGLDVAPAMQRQLAEAGDDASAEVLGIILRDEIGHVAIGNRWFRRLCAERGLDAAAHEALLWESRGLPRPRPPFNDAARQAAGFEPAELRAWQG